MSTTNHTTNYELSQYIGTDVTSYLSNYNSDMYKIDAQMKVNADDAAEAKSDAATAVATSTTAASNASAAVSTANSANTTAEAAQTAATAAQTAAGAAQTDAATALRASASNTIGNLAPAYDPTLTYAVGDLVTYVDPETNQGKLYKNIVPIAVPEEFNINKWDDVTTSEVYSRKVVTIIFNKNDYSSGDDILSAIRNYILNNVDNYITRKIDLLTGADGDYPTLYHFSGADSYTTAPALVFTAAFAGNTNTQNRFIRMGDNYNEKGNWITNTSGTSLIPEDLTTAPNSSYILSIL